MILVIIRLHSNSMNSRSSSSVIGESHICSEPGCVTGQTTSLSPLILGTKKRAAQLISLVLGLYNEGGGERMCEKTWIRS